MERRGQGAASFRRCIRAIKGSRWMENLYIYIYIKRKGILRFLEARKIDFSRVRLTWRVILVNYNIGEGRSVLFLCGGWSSSRGTTVNSI